MIRADLFLNQGLDSVYDSRDIIVTGKVVSIIETRDRYISFNFKVEEYITGQGMFSPGKVKLKWYNKNIHVLPGQSWQLAVRLKKPHGFMNPGGFDYESWLFQNRIRATGYIVNNSSANSLIRESVFSIHKYRQILKNTINSLLNENPFKGIILGLGIGDRSSISIEHEKLLFMTGTSHLLAISGLHIGIIAGLVYFFVCKLFSSIGIVSNIIPAQRLSSFVAIFSATIYSALAGFSIPTQRALIMLSVLMLFVYYQKTLSFSYITIIALLTILVLDPFATMSTGFWLSFSAIFLIAFGMSYRIDTNNIWWRWGRVQYLVSLGLLPVLVYFFQKYPVVSLLANLFAVPWVSIMVIPFVMLGTFTSIIFPGASVFLFSIASNALSVLFIIFEWLNALELDFWEHASINIWMLVCSLTGILIFLQPRGFPARIIGIYWLLPLFFSYKDRPEDNEFWFTLLDVGQGLSAVVQTRNYFLVYDTGAKFSDYFNAGSAVVLPYIQNQSVNKVNLLIISHGDNDHIGGAPYILDHFPETPVLTSVPARLKKYNAETCYSGLRWAWDGVDFEILHPNLNSEFTGNNNSCVLKVSTGQRSVLISGDIERAGEKNLLHHSKKRLQTTILIVPHHGSKSSSTAAFIDANDPEIAIFPVGYRNRYKLPNQDIISRYESRGIILLNSAEHGAITAKVGPRDMQVTTYRQKAQRFWHSKLY